jgi:hypothetical protein
LRREPTRVAQRGLVRRDEDARPLEVREHLLHDRRLAHLPRPGDDLREAPRLAQAGRERRDVLAPETVLGVVAHCAEYFYSMR